MKRFLSIALLVSCITAAYTQSNLTTYQLYKTLPQANYLNPAFMPEHKVVIGLPVISSINVAFANGRIALNEVLTYNANDSLMINSDKLPDVVQDKNDIKFVADVQLFNLGIRGKKSYFSFNIMAKNYTRLTYPGELIGWAIKGPAHPDYVNEALQISNFKFRGVSYLEAGVSYGRDMSNILPGLVLGLRVKLLKGIAAAQADDINGELFVGQDSVHLNTQEITVDAAGFDFFDSDPSSGDMVSYALSSKNTGFAVDFGATYKLTDRLSVSASVNDLGFITWKEYTSRYTISAVDYKFTGFDILSYLNNNSSGSQSIDAEIDSLENLFSDQETKGEQFKTGLITKVYLGVHYDLNKMHSLGATVYLDFFKEQVSPAFGLNYNLKLGRMVSVVLGAALSNGSISNVMGGLVLKLGANQFYLSSDRVNSTYYPSRASHANVHTGMNLVFGKPGKVKEEEPEEEEIPADTLQVEEITPADTLQVEEEILEVPDTTQIEAPRIEPETIQADTVQIVEEPIEIETDTVSVEPIVVQEPKDVVVLTKGDHEHELAVGNYVIVGVFKSLDNVERYSNKMKSAGYENSFGYVSEKGAYYVHTFYEATDVTKTREERDKLRLIDQFQFPDAWLLTIEE